MLLSFGTSIVKKTCQAMVESLRRPPESTVWECHGTGSCRPRLNHFQLPLNKNCARTSLGDPIEVGAVRKVGGATSDNHVPGIPPILEFNTIPFGYAAIYGHQYMATWQYVLWRCFKIWPAHNSVNRFFLIEKNPTGNHGHFTTIYHT